MFDEGRGFTSRNIKEEMKGKDQEEAKGRKEGGVEEYTVVTTDSSLYEKTRAKDLETLL